MRSDLSQEEKIQGVRDILQVVTKAKLPGHGINDPNFIKPDRPMSAIGG